MVHTSGSAWGRDVSNHKPTGRVTGGTDVPFPYSQRPEIGTVRPIMVQLTIKGREELHKGEHGEWNELRSPGSHRHCR